ncbi:MAG: DHH family phosphoesterase [Lachnospiraceae bacterium]
MKYNKIKLKGRLKNTMSWPLILTFFLIVMNIAVYQTDITAGVTVTGFTIVYFIVVSASYLFYKERIGSDLINFATQYGTVQKRLLREFEIPYALLDYDGKVLWMNDAFMEVTEKKKEYHKSITALFPVVTRELLHREQKQMDFTVRLKDKIYRLKLDRISFEAMGGENNLIEMDQTQEFLTAVYLFDETKLQYYMKVNKEQQLVSALVYIDNYDEALESIEQVKRSLLVALVDRKVNKYFQNMDGLVRKLEKDKYFVVFRSKYLSQMEEDRFSLIEDVKTVKVGNEMAVTLSIGIGVNGDGYNQTYEYARMAMDLALGRGGDQVVVKEKENVSYYGGKSKQVEKNTRVKARVKAHALREIMESRERVIIMGHSIPDADAFGAAIGVYCAARVLGKKAQIVLNTISSSLRPIKEQFTEERGYPPDMFINSEEADEIVDDSTLLMVVDCNRPSYTEYPALLRRVNTVVVFDHHRQGNEVIKNAVLSYIEPYASSTCEMIAEVLQYFTENIHLESCEADAIYAGILIDTNNYMTKTGVRTFEAAAYLRRCGAEVTRVRKLLQEDLNAYKARAEVVRHAEVYHRVFAISVCTAEDVESPNIVCAQAANELLNIVGIKASFVLAQYQGKIFVSSRSIDEINVQLIMERIGGGGHLNTAGAQLTGCTMEEAKKIVKRTIDEMMKEGDITE